MGIKNRNSICIWSPFMRCLVPARQLQDTGTPNNRMFQNTPEVSQMVFSVLQKPVWLIGSCQSKNYIYLFGCFRELWLPRKSQMAFSSHRKVLATLNMGPVGSLRTSSSVAFIRKLQGTFSPYTEIFRRPFLTVIAISWYHNVNNTTTENLSQAIRKRPNL